MSKDISIKNILSSLLLGPLVAACGVAIFVLVWGQIDVHIAGLHFKSSHPNRPMAIALLFLVAYGRYRHGITLRNQVQGLADFLSTHDRVVPVAIFLISALILLRIKLMQHFTFHTGAYDLAMYDTAIMNTLQGRFLFAEQLGRNFFSEHFSPVLLMFCPIYLLANTPVTLLVVECCCVAGGLVFAYKIVRHYDLSPLIGVVIAALFMNYSYLAKGVMFDFHPEMMEPMFILGCVYFLLKPRPLFYTIFLVLALSCKEDVPIYTLCLGAWALFRRETRLIGIGTCLISLVWAIVAWKLIIPFSMPQSAGVSHFVTSRWGHLGNGYAEVATTLLQRPLYVLSRVASDAPVEMLALLGFVPLLGIEFLMIALPGLILNTTSNFGMQANLEVHYAAPIIPFVIWAFIVGLKRAQHTAILLTRIRLDPGKIRIGGLCLLIILATLSFGLDYDFYANTPHVIARRRVMAQLPEGSTVSCETGFIPHLVRTRKPHLFPVESNHRLHYSDCDYILVDKAGNPWPLEEKDLAPAIDAVLGDTNNYTVVAAESGVYLLSNTGKRAPGSLPAKTQR